MNFNLYYILPELILAGGGILALALGLLTGRFAPKGGRPARIGVLSPEVVSLAVLLAALAASVWLLADKGLARGVSQFGGVMAVDGLALFFKIIAVLSTIIVALLSIDFFRGVQFHRGEYYALLVFAALAITSLAASTDLIMMYLSLEFLSITSYILAGYLKQEPKSNEAAVKYFLYGSVAAAVMIYGMSILYGVTGTTSILGISDALWARPAPYPLLFLSLMLMLVGFGFKIAMVPFHQWAPDTYEGAPTPIAAFLSVGSMAGGIAVLVRMLGTGITFSAFDWTPLIILLSAATMTVGNLVAIPQLNIKRMLAYSSIAQVGYLLLGVAAMAYSPLALPAILLYVFIYLFMNLGAFAVVTILSARLGSDELRDYAGLIRRAPVAAVAMVFFMLSLAGVPPTAGFLGKFYLFSAAIQSGHAAIFWLTVLAIANTVVSAYYYLNVVRRMFFAEAREAKPITCSRPLSFAIGLTLAMTLLVLLYAQPFIKMAHRSAAMLTGI
ncbi:MAG TPA: NADH-quinone oxidoreductase subunit N [Armatimonadota bacterium]|nr:NADH-quinone oxidoreductase subunit N [Armatimonadota bacterium]